MILAKVVASCALLCTSGVIAFAPSASVNVKQHHASSSSALLSASVDDGACDGRRAFLVTSAAAVVAGILAPPAAHADGADYKAVAADIAKIIKSDPNKGPTLVRLVSLHNVYPPCRDYLYI